MSVLRSPPSRYSITRQRCLWSSIIHVEYNGTICGCSKRRSASASLRKVSSVPLFALNFQKDCVLTTLTATRYDIARECPNKTLEKLPWPNSLTISMSTPNPSRPLGDAPREWRESDETEGVVSLNGTVGGMGNEKGQGSTWSKSCALQ